MSDIFDGLPDDADALGAGPGTGPGGSEESGGADGAGADDGYRSGFVALVGRPNVGKSTLVNRLVDHKVSIVSDKAQTTRHEVRGVLTRPDCQLVVVDTPGVSKPRTALGNRLNDTAASARSGVDVVCLVLDARSGVGRGDRFLAEQIDREHAVGVVNKIDGMSREQVFEQLAVAGELGLDAYFPVSAFTGRGVDALVDHLCSLMPPGPHWYPADQVRDTPEPRWVAELVREQLLRVTRQEVPHSVATRVTEWEWPRIRCEILVERDSQKGIVIGRGGSVLKDVGSRVRRQLPDGAYLELFVTVAPNWQQDRDAIERLGY